MNELPDTVSSRDFMHGDDERMVGRGNHSGGLPFRDYARALKEVRYVNAVIKHGPRIRDIAAALGVKHNQVQSWLIDATYRWPQLWEDDNGYIYMGRHGEGGKEYA